MMNIDMVTMVLDGIERDITESRSLLRKKNEKQVGLEETIQYLSRDNVILMVCQEI